MSALASIPALRCTNACEACRRRKVKCSGSQPCRSCVRHGFECAFPAAGRQGYSEGYVQSLLATIKRRENEIQSMKHRNKSIRDEYALTLDYGGTSQSSASKISTRSPGNSATELAPGPAFETRARTLLNDHAGSSRLHASPNESIHTSEISDESTSPWRSTAELIDGSEPPELPSEFQSHRLLGFFLPLMGVNQHFFDPRLFLDSMALLYQSEHSRREQMRSIWFTEYLLVMAMGKLIGCLAQRPGAPPGNIYFAEAMRRLPPSHQLGSHGIRAVEILCLIALYLQWCDRKHDAYLYIGNAIRLALAQGYHLPHDEQHGLPSELCHRVRVWWTAYMLDRRLSAGLGLPMAVDERQIRADLPRPLAGFQSPVPLIINIRIARLTGEIMTSFYSNEAISQRDLVQGIQRTLHTLHETGLSIPPSLVINFAEQEALVSRTSGSLYLMLFQAIILCIRPIILQSVKRKVLSHTQGQDSTDIAPIISKLCSSCHEAATKSIAILSSLQKQKKIPFFGFFDLDAVFSAAFIIVMMQFITENEPGTPPEGLEQSFEVLRHLSSAGNKAAEQRLYDLKQFCLLVWKPEIAAQWKWLDMAEKAREDEPVSAPPSNCANDSDTIYGSDSLWPGVWDEWPASSAPVASNNEPGEALFAFDFGETFEVDLVREAQGIYASFNDPSLPVTGVDQVDWVEMEKMFRT